MEVKLLLVNYDKFILNHPVSDEITELWSVKVDTVKYRLQFSQV